jgi:hypothetical protein
MRSFGDLAGEMEWAGAVMALLLIAPAEIQEVVRGLESRDQLMLQSEQDCMVA